jgi:S1-C subfamily serine protease
MAEAMGGNVYWNQDTKTVEIYTGDIAKAATQSVSCAMILVYDDYHVLKGQGSGFYYNGYIITNKHVLDMGTQWGVQFEDTPSNMEYLMKERIEVDTGGLDIGVIRAPIEKVKRKQVTFADSDKATVGQRVLAISCPSGVKNVVSEGYISKILREEDYSEIITTAQVTGGSSGGAVFDANNNLIGMIYGEISGYNGSSALISSNDIKKVLDKIK